MADDRAKLSFENFKDYKEKVDKAFEEELSLFERFSTDIIKKASNHHQVTINNLEESRESLTYLRDKVTEIKKSIFYHQETLIIDRQNIIQNTERQVQNQNQSLLEFEYKSIQEKVENFDYLNKALIQSAFDFFNDFKMYYSKDIIDLDELYAFLSDKNKTFEKVIQKYESEVMEFFTSLDNEIYEMNDRIALLMQQKNSQLNKIYDFFEKETTAYLDNQLTFSVETDLNSKEIKTLINDKLEQFKLFKNHLLQQEEKTKVILHNEYLELYEKVLKKLLQRKGNLLIGDPCFFDHVEQSLLELKEQIIFAKNENLGSLGSLIRTYNRAIKYKEVKADTERRARKMTRKFLKMKKGIFLEYQKSSRKLINQMEKYYKLYLDILKVDPFLAQIIGDKATKIVKDEVNYLSTLKINKEHKINVNYDIKTLKLNQQINEIESKLIYEVERQIYLQDIDLISTILDVQNYLVDKSADIALSVNRLEADKFNIFKLDKAINAYLKHDMKINNINRRYLNIVTDILIKHVRQSENHNIDLVEALSDIKLALKEYDIAAIHFKTMFENEKRFLVMQANRVSDETKIDDNYILTKYENQMRFAQEQINLANDELKLRVQAIMTAVDEERVYYQDIITNQEMATKKRQSDLIDEYQAKIYQQNLLVENLTEQKSKKVVEKEFHKLKERYETLIQQAKMTSEENQIIQDANRRLKTLEDHLEEALDEAVLLRDETIEEMQSLYNTAYERYEYFKNYLANKVEPLEPTFYQTLERMQSRYKYKLKTAEAELDIKTKDLLENYLDVYFTEQPDLDRAKLIENINLMQTEKEAATADYEQEIASIDLDFQQRSDDLVKKRNEIIKEAKAFKESITNKRELEIQTKQQELSILENRYHQQQRDKQISYESEIENLTNEYNQTLGESKKYIMNLSQSFEKVLNTYKPYVRLTKNNRKIRTIVKKTNHNIDRKEKKEFKVLEKELKKRQMLINK
ncbi:MAG: hypothetical protein RBQ64_01145 [Candidatus Izemoplasmatales bacterium]|jgi:hypothetical protein|nr:hypothetical protein [Candidatus Izemoplasmatales bacterium]